jgi:hypothetical protein
MHRKHLKKAAVYTLPILVIIFIFIYRYSCMSFFNEHFISQRVELPKKGEEFVITLEQKNFPTSDPSRMPRVMINIVKLAFPEYKIVADQTKTPNLIVRSLNGERGGIIKELESKAPYIIYSLESKVRSSRKYRANGQPTAQFIPFYKPSKENHLFLPFIVWGKTNLLDTNRRIPPTKEALMQKKNIVYVHTRCVPERDIFFRMLKMAIPTVEARGRCSNDGLERLSGDYNDLKNHYSGYKFTLSMEHGKYPGYITEKIANSFEAGNIPIYWGGTNVVNRFINPKSYIDLDSYMTFESAVRDIKNLSNDPERMQKMLSEPILTKEGAAMMGINDKNLSPESEEFLKEIAQKFRKIYIKKAKKKTIQEKIKDYLNFII